ncbi:MAG: sigma-70 family RNA polymerase sigma factor [Clostridia bacterium]|nr:sigma-70 family RNA polymerase sigma factor [Clostridia bacterium]
MQLWSQRLKEDPEQGIHDLMDRHGGLVYYIVRGILSGFPEDDIEECVSDVFFYIYQNRSRLKFEKQGIKSYLAVTAKHIAIDKMRRYKRIPEPVSDLVFETARSGCLAEEAALSNVERDELIRWIRDLGEPDATILIAKYYVGMTCSEIGELTGLRANTVAQRAGRAVRQLADRMKGGKRHVQ